MRYIALLRGINVGGNTMIKMSDLKAMFESLGFENVATYINSGNLAFDLVDKPERSKASDENIETELVSKIEKTIENHVGKFVPVMVRTQNLITELLNRNPYEGQYESHKEMHVLFLRAELTDDQKNWLRQTAPSPERFDAIGREIFCHLPMGVANSYLGRGEFEKKLKIAVTARNWRTVERLATL